MATLGQEIKAERERRSISIKDISDRTKIGTRILNALENDRWDLMPQKFLLKGVIKAFAETIGADPAVYLEKYEKQKAANEEAAEKERIARGWKKSEVRKKITLDSEKTAFGRGFRKFLLIIAALAAVAAVVFFIVKPGKKAETAAPVSQAIAPPSNAVPAAAAKEEPRPVETGLRLAFRFQADCWMHVRADGAVVMDGIKAAGSTAELRAEKEFIIQTGNAGGFEFTLNGKPGRALGGPGVVLTDIRINPENAASFLREETPLADSGGGR